MPVDGSKDEVYIPRHSCINKDGSLMVFDQISVAHAAKNGFNLHEGLSWLRVLSDLFNRCRGF
jgi:hypothetical protein